MKERRNNTHHDIHYLQARSSLGERGKIGKKHIYAMPSKFGGNRGHVVISQ